MSLERIAEEKIREAAAQGAFSNLPGAGKPLKHLDDDLAGDDRMGLHILRQNGFLPEWLELRKQIYAERADVLQIEKQWHSELAAWHTPSHPIPMRTMAQYRQRVKSINAKIDLHNLRCPAISLEIVRFQEP